MIRLGSLPVLQIPLNRTNKVPSTFCTAPGQNCAGSPIQIKFPIFIFISLLSLSISVPVAAQEKNAKVLLNDISRLNAVYVNTISQPREIADIQNAIWFAKDKHLKISIAGKRHSQGGHIVYDGALVLDMREFNKILALDKPNKIVTVQSGATWEDLQNYLNPYVLSVKVMQASNIFTVGGSLSSNVHGNDPCFGPIIETVRSFRLLGPEGAVLNVSRTENPELFRLAIGGFGLFGVILDVDLMVTDNDVYESQSFVMEYSEYPGYFENNVRNNPNIGIQSAKLSIAPESLLREIVSTAYEKTNDRPEGVFDLRLEENITRNKLLFGMSRRSGWGKSVRWYFQKKLEAKVGKKQAISRNNAMRPIIKFLDYSSRKDTDILQEYFVPKDKFVSFVDGLREIVGSDKINLTSVTVRHIPKNAEAYLSYAREESFAVVLYINQPLSEAGIRKAEIWTRKLVDLAIGHGGTYYLTYQLYPSEEQIRKSYPEIDSFFEKKRTYDPEELFMNKFYEKYSNPVN